MSQSTTSGRADVLDHLAVVSAAPDALYSTYERLGFTMSPVARHSGSATPGGPVELWGIGNRCAMFADGGYLELMAIFDQSLYCRGFPERLERYAGLHIVAFECADADSAAAALRACDVPVLGVGHLERPVDTPEGERVAKFSLVRVEPGLTPECHFNILQHHTPEFLWQPALTEHANGARQLLSVEFCVDDPAASAARFARLLDATPETVGGMQILRLRRGLVAFMTPGQLADGPFGAPPPSVPFVASFGVHAPDLGRVQGVLDANGVDHERHPGSIIVRPEAAMGAMITFEEAIS